MDLHFVPGIFHNSVSSFLAYLKQKLKYEWMEDAILHFDCEFRYTVLRTIEIYLRAEKIIFSWD